MNYKDYNNGHIESAIQIKIDNEITEIRYLLGIGLYKIYSGENVDFYSEFGAEVAYNCQEKSNISAAVDQNNFEELLNIYENIDFVFNTRDDKILNDDIEIIGKGGLISKGMFNLIPSSKNKPIMCSSHFFTNPGSTNFFTNSLFLFFQRLQSMDSFFLYNKNALRTSVPKYFNLNQTYPLRLTYF